MWFYPIFIFYIINFLVHEKANIENYTTFKYQENKTKQKKKKDKEICRFR